MGLRKKKKKTQTGREGTGVLGVDWRGVPQTAEEMVPFYYYYFLSECILTLAIIAIEWKRYAYNISYVCTRGRTNKIHTGCVLYEDRPDPNVIIAIMLVQGNIIVSHDETADIQTCEYNV